MHAALEEILRSPEFPSLFEQLRQHREEEQARRERFYEETTPERKAEFINGEVVMHSPAQVRHGRVSRRLVNLLGNYVDRHGLGEVAYEKMLVVLERNDYEPDVIFYGREKSAALRPEQLKLPPPDFAVEILSPSTERYDRGIKREDYALNGVGEYWIVDPVRETVEKYVLGALGDRTYVLAGTFGGGAIHCDVVKGFEIPVRALFDDAENRAALDRILAAAN